MKPCPFCESLELDFLESGTLLDIEDGSSMGPKAEPAVQVATTGVRVYCYQCGAIGPRVKPGGAPGGIWANTAANARQLWNERVEGSTVP